MSPELFVKRVPAPLLGQPLYEAAGLRWLGEGGAPVAKVVDATADVLSTERVVSVPPTPEAARELGRNLAWLHASGASHFGAAPDGYKGAGWMGAAPLELPTRSEGWGEFYSRYRIRPYLRSVFTGEETEVLEHLCLTLESGVLDHPQPSLVRQTGHGAARIHGDLWAGNVMWSPQGCVLIDPAAQGGHAEEDLAALHTFGAPYLKQIIGGYQEESLLAPGWERRIGLHQMHILMVHCYLFGRSYVPETVGKAREVLERSGSS